MATLNATHDPARRSWVESANRPDADFPIQNLPFGIFRNDGLARGGVAIGDRIFDLQAGLDAGLFSGAAERAARAGAASRLNALMALGNGPAGALRARLSDLLRADGPERAKVEGMADRLLVPMAAATMELPVHVGNFTDFLTSSYHTERGGRVSRPDNPLPVNFKHLPIAYHSRASSVRLSGEPVRRPNGQSRSGDSVVFGPSKTLDFELELAAFIGPGNALGTPIPLAAVPRQIFGYALLNDWSARDIQRWETTPLGPFLGKSFSTTISPWVVTQEALAPFRAPAFTRAAGDPAPLPYLQDKTDAEEGGLDLAMEAYYLTPRMREAKLAPARVTASNVRHLYWTLGQMITHHASNGCNLQPGDIIGSGTVSGPTDESRACLNELSVNGTQSFALPGGDSRRYLEDGDEVIFRARASRAGHVSIGFGECRGRIEPAPPWPEG